jgi:hypothetical protein
LRKYNGVNPEKNSKFKINEKRKIKISQREYRSVEILPQQSLRAEQRRFFKSSAVTRTTCRMI